MRTLTIIFYSQHIFIKNGTMKYNLIGGGFHEKF